MTKKKKKDKKEKTCNSFPSSARTSLRVYGLTIHCAKLFFQNTPSPSRFSSRWCDKDKVTKEGGERQEVTTGAKGGTHTERDRIRSTQVCLNGEIILDAVNEQFTKR